MRRIACLMCAFILVLMVSAQADTIPFNGMEFSTEAEYLNMGDTRILDLPSFYSGSLTPKDIEVALKARNSFIFLSI